MAYRRRIIDETLDEVFPHLAAIALEGAKGVGKTATASQRAATVLSMEYPEERAALASDLDLVAQLERPVLIDEWQLEPGVWDRVRHSVDEDGRGGHYLLAGSAGPPPGVRIHSGAGRIVSLAMRPLSFSERGIHPATVSLGALLRGAAGPIAGTSSVDLPGYTDEILRSGFPGIRPLEDRPRRLQLNSYIARIVERELPENGIEVRRPRALRAWLAAYAAATATTANYSTILAAATAGETDKPTRQTAEIYREHLHRLFVLDPLEPWTPASSPLKRLGQSAKHHLVDPALAARLVGIERDGLLRGQGRRVPGATETWLSALFESLVVQSVRVYADASDATVGHLRTRNGDHEIDLIVEAGDGSCVAIEVKLSNTVHDDDIKHLNWLHGLIGKQLTERVIVNTGRFAYRRPDGVAVIPLALLGP